jgi:Type I phosphodiesterase / nucleotide pyrophosphatase
MNKTWLFTLLLAAGLAQAAPERPRLVVFMAIDGLPMRQVEAWREQFGPDGLRRFFDHGVTFTNARYAHAHTVTGVGHATMLTGATPKVHGIISNDWTDPTSLRSVYCTEDAAHNYIEAVQRKGDSGTSPKNLLAQTVGDVLREREPSAKVLGVSGKDRGAILPAGKLGTAYMYLVENGRFTSSTYYMQQHPAWVHAFNARRPADALWGATWSPLLPEESYAADAPDNSPWMASAGYGRALPATLGAGMSEKGARFYSDLITSPFGDQLTLDFARAALKGEGLGQDKTPDILSISLSSHDYISHAFGPESRLVHDHLLHVDRQLAAFFKDLDATVGKDRYVLVLTADHGFSDTPEWRKQKGLPGGRVQVAGMLGAVNTALTARFGKALVRNLSAGGLLFDEAQIQALQLDPQAVYETAVNTLRGIEGIEAAYGPADLTSTTPPRADQKHLAAMRLAWNPQRSAPVLLAVAEGWIYGSRFVGATHGSPHRYDQHVPILFWGPRWFGAARTDQAVEVTSIAPTLAHLLRIPAPAQSEGALLPLPKPGR